MQFGIRDMHETDYLLKEDAWIILELGLWAPSRNAGEVRKYWEWEDRYTVAEANKYSKYKSLLEKRVQFE